MLATAKVFSTGNSQAVRLPKAFRVGVREMWISRNELDGTITLKPKDDDEHARKVNELFDWIAANPIDDDFEFRDPKHALEMQRDVFADWEPDKVAL